MYHVGDVVVYGIHGVCHITAEEVRLVDRKRIRYFVLERLRMLWHYQNCVPLSARRSWMHFCLLLKSGRTVGLRMKIGENSDTAS